MPKRKPKEIVILGPKGNSDAKKLKKLMKVLEPAKLKGIYDALADGKGLYLACKMQQVPVKLVKRAIAEIPTLAEFFDEASELVDDKRAHKLHKVAMDGHVGALQYLLDRSKRYAAPASKIEHSGSVETVEKGLHITLTTNKEPLSANQKLRKVLDAEYEVKDVEAKEAEEAKKEKG